jgi:Spy/CpxP family protein refolding chaperone
MKQWRAWVLLILVFGAGAATGTYWTRRTVRGILDEWMHRPELIGERMERQMVSDLGLTPDQVPRIHEVFVRSQARLKEYRKEWQPRFSAIVADGESDFRKVLTPEQQAKFDRFKEERAPFLQFPAKAPE